MLTGALLLLLRLPLTRVAVARVPLDRGVDGLHLRARHLVLPPPRLGRPRPQLTVILSPFFSVPSYTEKIINPGESGVEVGRGTYPPDWV